MAYRPIAGPLRIEMSWHGVRLVMISPWEVQRYPRALRYRCQLLVNWSEKVP